jgi:hypothetical protein
MDYVNNICGFTVTPKPGRLELQFHNQNLVSIGEIGSCFVAENNTCPAEKITAKIEKSDFTAIAPRRGFTVVALGQLNIST